MARVAVVTVASLLAIGMSSTPVAATPVTSFSPAMVSATRGVRPSPDAREHVVTMVTGDRAVVRLRPDGVRSVDVLPATGRAAMPVFQQISGGHAYVLPADVLGALDAGRLDPRRLDVGALAARGVTDARAAALPPAALGPTRTTDTAADQVTVRVLGRRGEPAPDGHAVVLANQVDGPWQEPGTLLPVRGGVARGQLAPGVYTIVAGLDGVGGPQATVVLAPRVRVAGPTHLTLDARHVTTPSITMPRADAQPTGAVAGFCWSLRIACGGQFWVSAPALTDTAFSPTAPGATPPDFRFTVMAHYGQDPDQAQPSPYTYHVAQSVAGGIPEHPAWRLTSRDFATVHARYRAQVPGEPGEIRDAGGSGADVYRGALLAEHLPALPTTRTEYYQGGVLWTRRFTQGPAEQEPGWDSGDQVAYTAGQTYADAWNTAVRGPGLAPHGNGNRRQDYRVRRGGSPTEGVDQLVADVDMYADPSRRQGAEPSGRSTTTTLYDDATNTSLGTAHGDLAAWLVGSGDMRLRLTETSTSSDPGLPLSSSVTGSWTFTSRHADVLRPVPLTALTFAPQLDEDNRARYGATVPLALDAYRQPDLAPPQVRCWSLRVSFDDGATWRAVAVTAAGGHAAALIQQPSAGSGYASLEAWATTTDGDLVRERVIRAWRLY
jgi:hypothetical protein